MLVADLRSSDVNSHRSQKHGRSAIKERHLDYMWKGLAIVRLRYEYPMRPPAEYLRVLVPRSRTSALSRVDRVMPLCARATFRRSPNLAPGSTHAKDALARALARTLLEGDVTP